MNFLRIFIITALLLLTVVIGITSPKLHKTFVITGSDFKLERYTEKLTQSEIKIASQQNEGVQRPVKIEPSVFMTDKKTVVQPSEFMSEEKPVVTDSINPDNMPLELQEQLTQLVNEVNEDEPSAKLTKREELIAWNKWRSDIMNDVMLKASVDAPIGTFFYFSFKVDKFRHISNIKAFSTNPMYSKEVKDKLVPTIKKMEYTQILEFPKGSERDSTVVRGMFAISNETSLSNPNDFNDLERVNVYE